MWVAFKCKQCGIEWADSDIDLEEIEQEADVQKDKHGQYLTICEDCQ